ncbi:MAG: hypothetical protein EB150_09570, partial [Nitrososphaeria archaeon]|nr:hypothetical protein [Nitrososphaeria archaeon]
WNELRKHGKIFLNGKQEDIQNPGAARMLGVETVYQQLALVDTFDISENLFIGRELRKRGILGMLGVLNRKEMRNLALQSIEKFGARFPDLNAKVQTTSSGEHNDEMLIDLDTSLPAPQIKRKLLEAFGRYNDLLAIERDPVKRKRYQECIDAIARLRKKYG